MRFRGPQALNDKFPSTPFIRVDRDFFIGLMMRRGTKAFLLLPLLVWVLRRGKRRNL
jgi:hypothetical protein